jgi:hypothetical protein
VEIPEIRNASATGGRAANSEARSFPGARLSKNKAMDDNAINTQMSRARNNARPCKIPRAGVVIMGVEDANKYSLQYEQKLYNNRGLLTAGKTRLLVHHQDTLFYS